MLTDLGDFQLPSSSRDYNAYLNKCCYGFLIYYKQDSFTMIELLHIMLANILFNM